MKHQYFGDINDYRKYGLLRGLAGDDLSILVAWMLTPNDSRSDGKFIQYLSAPGRWKGFDSSLFETLYQSVAVRQRRHTSEIENSGVLPRARFIRTVLDGSPDSRVQFASELAYESRDVDLVFFDPDNGLAVKSVSKTSKAAPKYVFWDELRAAWSSRASLLVYQHFPRIKREIFLDTIAAQFRQNLCAAAVVACVTSNVAFFLVPQGPRGNDLVERAGWLQTSWRGQFTVKHL